MPQAKANPGLGKKDNSTKITNYHKQDNRAPQKKSNAAKSGIKKTK